MMRAHHQERLKKPNRRLCMAGSIMCVLVSLYCVGLVMDLKSVYMRRTSHEIQPHDTTSKTQPAPTVSVTNKPQQDNANAVDKDRSRPGGWPNPIIVVGLPKTGTTSIASYFKCGGVTRVSHWRCKGEEFCGPMILENVRSGKPPLSGTGDYDVYAQLDIEVSETCYFPQVEVLNEIHEAHPMSTFIFNSRNITGWVKSIRGWYNMVDRLTNCNITGFPTGVGQTDNELIGFYNSQRQRVRDFVALHPSHRLVEVEIDSPDAGKVMEDGFGIDRNCWGQTNVGKEIVPKWDANS